MNRHDVIIWDAELYGTPKSFAEAVETSKILVEQKSTSISPKIRLFAKEVFQATAQSDNEDLQESYARFCEGVETCDTAALDLEISDFGWEEELILLVDTAMKHGLVVVDTEMAMAFMPPNKILPIETKARWTLLKQELKQKKNFPKTLKQFEKWSDKLLMPVLAKYGFHDKIHSQTQLSGNEAFDKISSKVFSRKISDDISVCVEPRYYNYKGELSFDINVTFYSEKVYDIYKKFSFNALKKKVGNFNFFTEIIEDTAVNNIGDALKKINLLESVLFKIILDITDEKGLNSLFNGNVYEKISYHLQHLLYMPHCLIIARLANDPNFEKLALELGRYDPNSRITWGAHAPHQITEWPKLVKYLRDEVKPLV